MDFLEVLHRARSLAWMVRRRGGVVPTSMQRLPPVPWTIVRPAREDSARLQLLEEADAYLQHRWLFFGLNGLQEDPIDWQVDPSSGKGTTLSFSPRLDFRNPEAVGSIKNIWEKNRHQHLTVLAAAFALSGAERYAAEVADQILGWVDANPFLLGANWVSPLESGIRLISWVWCERLLRASTNYDAVFGPQSPVWTSVYQQQLFIDRAYAQGSSANNHVIGEMAGQFVASSAWPCFPESQAWKEKAAAVLEEQRIKQTFPSGLNREQAFDYHLFVTEFLLLCLYEARRSGFAFSDSFSDAVRKMVEAIPVLTDVGGHLPNYGDGDDGLAVRLRSAKDRRDAWIFDFARVLLDADVPAKPEPSISARLAGFDRVPPKEFKPRDVSSFEDAGLHLLVADRGSPAEVFTLCDAGPQGFLSLAAHGHADALAFTLSVGGKSVLVDPGTYCYHAEPHWRDYFRSTKAHNTVTVDGVDQAVAGGTFLWLKKADARVIEARREGGRQWVTAEHRGYERLAGRVVHRRKLELDGRTLVIEDDLSGTGEHLLEWRFHFSPDCRVELESGVCRVSGSGGGLVLRLDEGARWSLVKGGDDAGWFSPGFGVRVPSFTLCGTMNRPLPARGVNRIEIA